MAAVGAVRTAHATLGAGVADTVTLTDDGVTGVRVYNRATATGIVGVNDVFVLFGGAATVAGAETTVVPPGTSRVVKVSNYDPSTGGTIPTSAVVSVISAAAVAYSVEAV